MYVDASVTQFYPKRAATIDVSSVDADLTTIFSGQPWARKIYIGSATGNISVQRIGDASPVVYVNVPQGTWMVGVFTKVTHSGTTVSSLVVEE